LIGLRLFVPALNAGHSFGRLPWNTYWLQNKGLSSRSTFSVDSANAGAPRFQWLGVQQLNKDTKMRLNLLAVFALFISATILPGQTIKGKIVGDSAGVPLQGVLITLLNAKGDTVETSVRSDAAGEFVLRTKDVGRYRLRATRLAFQPVTTDPFDLLYRTIVDVRLVMSPQAVLLSPMVVVGSRVMSGADMMSGEGFEFRRRRYTGHFADTASLRKSGYPPFTSSLKEFVPGLFTVVGFFGNEEIRMTVQGAECTPDLYKDGVLQQSLSIQHINGLNSADFYGVEVYRRPNVPPELRRTGLDCAAIAIWTKWYSNTRGRGG
jgi:hypothetical protein